MKLSYVITIDGPAGAGKSSISKRLAKELKIKYLDTGAIYRAIALILAKSEIKPDDENFLREALSEIKIELRDNSVLVNDFDVSSEIRTPEVDNLASIYSALPIVREALLHLQKEQKNYGSVVAEGRDVGSVVFPDAEIKFFLTASPQARAKRRYLERIEKGKEADYDEILSAIIQRDEHDSKRDFSPLKIPDNAIFIDSSDMTEDEVLKFILDKIKEVLPK
ncbi:MAG: (d)CMP kinase [Synergistaceae bacterium]|nr:(d)CMP kinase [Synergistaceae bacterium]MBQ6738742.1 (d)CMP kinase [Synergistaceae bacterium]MBQ7068306.1 (d)CMP kinase [Synergistaceae bacterium]MBR0080359.1 (d)CMP kinase [Synergistaceae bacterium]MBR0232937.1 (d)CMP kinase [Synergistaceae bacterium]